MNFDDVPYTSYIVPVLTNILFPTVQNVGRIKIWYMTINLIKLELAIEFD